MAVPVGRQAGEEYEAACLDHLGVWGGGSMHSFFTSSFHTSNPYSCIVKGVEVNIEKTGVGCLLVLQLSE